MTFEITSINLRIKSPCVKDRISRRKSVVEKQTWRIRLRGPLGQILEKFCTTRLAALDFDRFLEPWRNKGGSACGKDIFLWGQLLCCAIQALPYLEDPGRLDEKIRRSVGKLMKLQEPDGAITAFPGSRQLEGADIPGRRYVLKALLLAASMPGADGNIKECCIRMCDQIMSLIGPGKRSILHCGVLGGLDSSALLEVITGVYRLTGERRFLEFARYIFSCGCSQQHDIFQALSKGMAPAMLANGDAVGLTDCFRGAALLGMCDSEAAELCSGLCRLYMERIAAEELSITGSGGGGSGSAPRWCGGALHQIGEECCGGTMGSTAVTAACIEFFHTMTGVLADPGAAVALAERSFYNALQGAWDPEKCQWAPFDPAMKENSVRNKDGVEGDLYERLRGAEALVLAPSMAFVPGAEGGVINFYEDMEAELSRKAFVQVSGSFPGSSRAEVRLRSRNPFKISLRIPEYCTGVYYCGSLLDWKNRSYLTIDRPWELDEVLTFEFDPRLRAVNAPDNSPWQAFMRGPLVLAVDKRGAQVPEAIARVRHNGLSWVDFASAGKLFGCGSHFNVWFRKMLPEYLRTPVEW